MDGARLIAASLSLLLLGCDAVWNAANRGTAEADLQSVLEKHQLRVEVERCRMIGSTRDAICAVRAEPEEIEQAIRALGLQPLVPNAGLPATAPELCREAARFAAGEPVVAFGLSGRPAIFVLGHGGAFESIHLFFDPQVGRGCVRISYAYG
jgi:hypothetical protein